LYLSSPILALAEAEVVMVMVVAVVVVAAVMVVVVVVMAVVAPPWPTAAHQRSGQGSLDHHYQVRTQQRRVTLRLVQIPWPKRRPCCRACAQSI
jgi:hypothetical protein